MTLSAPFFCDERTDVGRLVAEALQESETAHGTAFVRRVRAEMLSMLAEETLHAIHRLAAETRGAVIEVGAYVGGATLCILDATRERDNLVITVEEDVAHPSHPHIPTDSTVTDLHRNVEAFELARPTHQVLAGASFEAWVLGTFRHAMIGRSADLLVLDADVGVDRDLILLAPFLSEGCTLVIDDYATDNSKSSQITRTIDEWTARGILEPAALLPWATWFGRLVRPLTAAEVEEAQARWEAAALAGDPYCQRWIDYRARLSGAEATPPLTKAERMAFWRRVSGEAG